MNNHRTSHFTFAVRRRCLDLAKFFEIEVGTRPSATSAPTKVYQQIPLKILQPDRSHHSARRLGRAASGTGAALFPFRFRVAEALPICNGALDRFLAAALASLRIRYWGSAKRCGYCWRSDTHWHFQAPWASFPDSEPCMVLPSSETVKVPDSIGLPAFLNV
jgi:hypothetical protein